MTKRESTLQANSNFGSDTPVRLRYSSSAQILRYSETPSSAQIIGQLPRVSGEDPERIRVDSVFETFVCLFVLWLLENLLFFCTIKYEGGVICSQWLKSPLFVCLLLLHYNCKVNVYKVYKVYSIGPTWSWPVMSAPACILFIAKISKEFIDIWMVIIWMNIDL